MIESARALGRRAIVSSGWADLSLIDNGTDCLSMGEVNQQRLFRRVAAVVHHGGAGATTAAAMAGAPQAVIPQTFDQSIGQNLWSVSASAVPTRRARRRPNR